jgi:hypothetical protein
MSHILGTVNGKTSLKTIVEMVQDDFGIVIGNDTAKAIREAVKRNCLLWDATKIITTDSSHIRIAKDENWNVEANVDYWQ